MDEINKWYDKYGIAHCIPDGSCVSCKHCTDVFLDPFFGNEIYLCLCELGYDCGTKSRKCNDYKLKGE